jgi:hypothetical protein
LLNWLTGEEQNGKIKTVKAEDTWTLLTDTSSWNTTNPDAKLLNRKLEFARTTIKLLQ